MSLLFDENCPARLIDMLADLAPGSTHPERLRLRRCEDDRLWLLAQERSLTIVTKDDDFRQRVALHGAPPKVIMLAFGNASTRETSDILRRSWPAVAAFLADASQDLLVIHRNQP